MVYLGFAVLNWIHQYIVIVNGSFMFIDLVKEIFKKDNMAFFVVNSNILHALNNGYFNTMRILWEMDYRSLFYICPFFPKDI